MQVESSIFHATCTGGVERVNIQGFLFIYFYFSTHIPLKLIFLCCVYHLIGVCGGSMGQSVGEIDLHVMEK